MTHATRAKEIKVLFAKARHRRRRDLHLHCLGVTHLPIIGELLEVVITDAATVAEALTARVARYGRDLRGRPLQRGHLLAHQLMLHVPEAAGAKVDLHCRIGGAHARWRGHTDGCTGSETQSGPTALEEARGRANGACTSECRREEEVPHVSLSAKFVEMQSPSRRGVGKTTGRRRGSSIYVLTACARLSAL